MANAVEAETRAIETLGSVLKGSDRALVIAFPTMALPLGRLATEEDSPHPQSPGYGRAPSERAALALASKGIRSSVIRLAPAVHARTKLGLVSRMIDIAKKTGVSAYVADGQNCWSAVSLNDTSQLFRLALEKGSAGSKYHAVAEERILLREIAESIGNQLNVPVVSKSKNEASKHFGFLAPFIAADNPVSSQLTQQRLEWHPTGPLLLSNIREANVFKSPASI